MPFTNTTAAAYGLLVMYAMDMYEANPATLTPPAANGLTAAGWTIFAYIAGTDTILPRGVKGPLQKTGTPVCYGYVARNAAGDIAVAVRGTDGFAEWVEDGEFLPRAYAPTTPLPPGQPAMTVEDGFWGVYASMTLVAPGGAALGTLAPAIGKLAAAAPQVVVLGHSLGAALATYLTLDLVRGDLGARVSACLFASPQTGDQPFVTLFDQSVADYRLFDYILDIVPRVPTGPIYQPLPRRTVIQPAGAEAAVRVDIGCNHHVICYCAMLDYEATMAALTPVPVEEQSDFICILGPETGSPSIAKELVSLIAGAVPV
jgi:triacylglycerol lipase